MPVLLVGRWRYMDARETPKALANWVGLSPLACLAWAAARVSASMTVGRPPVRPWARAAARPAMVRSRIMSRSSSANAAILTKKNFPSPVGL